ncbi:MAG: GldG family protein [Oscillospiraceae bacterium]|jgi:hypothetical protein|nr:GldG family protein [Oscillospiraceae bacterium]
MSKNKTSTSSKNIASTGLAIGLAALILAVIIPINLIAGRLGINWDMTPKGVFKLTDTTKDILENLDQDVYVYTLFDWESAKDLPGYSRQFMPFYNIYKSFSDYEHVIIKKADPNTEEGRKIIEDSGIPENYTWAYGDTLVTCNGLIQRILSDAQFAWDYNNSTIHINTENDLTSAIKYVAAGITPVVYYMTGHGELDISQYSALSDNMKLSGYKLTTIDLTKGNEIPSDARVLLCINPQKDFTDEEYTQITNYLQNGGSIELIMPPNESEEPFENIVNIMDTFGLKMNYDSVYDESYHAPEDDSAFYADIVPYTPPSYTADGAVEYEGDPANITNGVIQYANNGGNSGIEGFIIQTYMPRSRSFYAEPSGDDVKFAQLLVTYSEDGTTYTAVGTPMGGPYKDTQSVGGSEITLAAYAVNKAANDAAMVVFGADFLNNTLASSEYYINPLYLFITTITWLHETNIDLGIPSKIVAYDSMTFENQAAADKIITLLIAIPAIVALIGVGVYFKRGRIKI